MMFEVAHITLAREAINILAERREFKANGTSVEFYENLTQISETH